MGAGAGTGTDTGTDAGAGTCKNSAPRGTAAIKVAWLNATEMYS